MADVIISKHKFRKGTNDQRKTIIFDQGEPAYTIDTKRFYIGTGTLSGGSVIGSKVHPILSNYYSLSTTVAEINDIVVANNKFYQLTAVDYTNVTSWADISPIIDSAATTKFRLVSANFDSTYTIVGSNSANWNSTYTIVGSNSANWNGIDVNATNLVRTLSSVWTSTFATVSAGSPSWNIAYNTVLASEADWDYAYDSVLLGEDNWDSVYTTVQSNSATWGSTSLYKAISATYTVLNADQILNCIANTFTVTLPTAVGIQGKTFIVKNSGAGTVTLSAYQAQTIDNVNTVDLTPTDSLTIVSTDANWIII